MVKNIKFSAIIHRTVTDREGESRVTFTVPLSDLDCISKLSQSAGKVLLISVEVIEDE